MGLEAVRPAAVAEYFCPMHPEVVRDRPGSCPKCGMALEARIGGGEEAPNTELADMSRRFWIGLGFTAPLFVLMLVEMLPHNPLHAYMGMKAVNWQQLLLASIVVFWCGWPFFDRAIASIVNRSPNMFTLIALGVGAAYLYSAAATIVPNLFPEGFRQPDGSVSTYFETAAAIIVLVLLGQVLELKARGRTGSAVRKLLGLAPRSARLVRPEGDLDIALERVRPGDMLRIRPGEKVPVDGIVTEGRSTVDESMISGEPVPALKEVGAPLIGATINGSGTLVMRAEKVGADTLLAQIVRMVGDAQRSRAPIQRLADRVSAYFVPAVLAVSVLAFLGWSTWGPPPALLHAMLSAVAVLIIACPCALGLATPMAIMVGTGRGAESGVLFKDALALEILERVDTLVVDKTGTLTEGKPRVVAVEPAPGVSAEELLRIAAALERGSEHPLAAAVLNAAKEKSLAAPNAWQFEAVPGKGIRGRVDDRLALLGNPALLADAGVRLDGLYDRLQALRAEGQTVVVAAVDGRYLGLLGVADPIRPSTMEAIRRLHADGLRIIMLTGDSRQTAEAVARRLGIDEVHAEVLPGDKQAVIKRLQGDGRIVAMAGDGINDAPALAQAQVGIALGTGTDVAMESAGITLVQGDLRGIARAISLSRATMRVIRQNLFLAFVYNVLGVPAAALGLLSPVLAGAAMSLSSLSVVGNSLRLRRARL
jgi:Cu+-exporting ATPase